ncbi:hypothetical protein N431DRAFT_497714 [Stipitochalara longipes BDJ]|nr:hypothetical protein N431DRAFT_497714 [Stipitochalara longipes BDJ]
MLTSLKALGHLLFLASPILGLALDRQVLNERDDDKVSAGPYKTFIREDVSVFDNENNGRWQLIDADGDFLADLCYIKTVDAKSNSVEVHCASARSGYKDYIIQTKSIISPAETDGSFMLVPSTNSVLPDLVFIKTANAHSNNVEVHIATGASNYAAWSLQVATVFGEEENGTWKLYDWDGDGVLDLIYIKTRNDHSNMVEVHVADGNTNFKTYLLEVATTFAPEDTDGLWQVGNYTGLINQDRHAKADLIFIKDYGTTHNFVEVHIASGASNYATRIQEVESVFACEQNGIWSLVQYDSTPGKKNQRLDLVYIKYQATNDQNKVEVHIASGSG